MSTHAAPRRLSSFLWFVFSIAVLLTTSLAHAAGRVEWKSKEAKEREGGSWRLEVAIYLASAPDVPHVPMKFEFQPTAYYERSMVEGDKLLERMVPLEHRQSLIESVDVGFLDSGSGKIEKRTRFSFKVTRAHGYEAGEYKVTIRDGRNGKVVGAATTLKFTGENEIIDRRPMVFTGKKTEKPKDGEGKAKGDANDEAKPASDETTKTDEAASEPAESPDAEGADEPSDSGGSDGPPPIEEKPGGCGCRFDQRAGERPLGFGLLALVGLGLLTRRRRVS